MARPRSRSAAVGALVVALTAVACTTVPARRSGPLPRVTPTSPARSTPATRPLRPGDQRVWLHGVGVDAPAGWKRDALRCGLPQQDTLIVETIGTPVETCKANLPHGLSVVWLGDYQGGLRAGMHLGRVVLTQHTLAGLHHRTLGGLPVLASLGHPYLGATLDMVVLPNRHVYLFAWSPDKDLLTRTLESLQTVAVDPDTGCRVYTKRYDAVRRLPPASRRTIVAGTPTGAEACYYVDGWLEAGVTMPADKSARLARVLNRAKTVPVSHACRNVKQGTYFSPGPMALRFHFDGLPDQLVVARIAACGSWTSYVTNGTTTHRLGRPALHLIPRLWGYVLPPSVK